MKRISRILLAVGLLAFAAVSARAISGAAYKFFAGSDGNAQIYIDPNENMNFVDAAVGASFKLSNVKLNSLSNFNGPTPSTTSSLGDGYTAYLTGPNNAAQGSVLCATPTVVGQGVSVWVCPAVSNYGAFVGVAAAATTTGNAVNVYTSGFAQVLTTGTVNAGDELITSANSAGYAQSNYNVNTTTKTLAVAENAGNAAGGLTIARIR